MSFVINTNVMSLVAQQNLNESQQMLNQAIARLSSGKRINSAADDAAGQAIANRMTAQIQGLQQARSNANDGISLAQTTEGALNQINANLQRIRELSVQAANSTLSSSDLQSIQDEITQRLDEIDRISAQTTFNGVNVLASQQTVSIQVGDDDDEIISIELNKITSTTLGLSALDMTNQMTSADVSAVGPTLTPATSAQTVALSYPPASLAGMTLKVADDGSLYVEDGASNTYAATFDSSNNTVTIDTSSALGTAPTDTATTDTTFVDSGGNLVDFATAQAATLVDTAAGATYDVHLDATSDTMYITDGTDTWTVGSNGNSIDLTTGVVTLGTKDATPVPLTGFQQVTTGNILTVPGSAAVNVDMSTVDTNLGGSNTLLADANGNYYIKHADTTSGDITYYSATADTTTGMITAGSEVVIDPLQALDDALAAVDKLRSGLGAMQNRFDSAISNLATTVTNLTAARSRIVDADYAVAVSQMSKAQILQQAGTSVLAQANMSQQSVLSLLR